MKLKIHTEEYIHDKHDWKNVSTEFAHMNNVSWLGWCKKCGKEAVTCVNISKCKYSKTTYKTEFNGEFASSSTKMKKAEKNGTKCVTYDQFIDIIKNIN